MSPNSTRQRVLQAIDDLGYQPSAVARSLATQRTHMVGLVTIDYEDHFYAGVASGVQDEVQKHGWMLVITSNARNRGLEQEYVRQLCERQVEGLVVIRDSFLKPSSEFIDPLANVDVPLVVVCQSYLTGNFPCLDIDNIHGAYLATRHLIDAGHRQIATVTPPTGYQVTRDRLTGFMRAHDEAGLQPDSGLVVEGNWFIEGGYSAARELLEKGRSFTAVFCQNDHMAIGAMRVFHEAGLKIPEDVSLVGYDDISIAEHLTPPLTTVWQPKRELGAAAVNLVMERIKTRDLSEPQVTLLQPKLIQRESVLRIQREEVEIGQDISSTVPGF